MFEYLAVVVCKEFFSLDTGVANKSITMCSVGTVLAIQQTQPNKLRFSVQIGWRS